MEKVINYSFDKQTAIRLVKKAISGKAAILKDNGDVLKVGAPMMTATITISDNTITVSGSLAGAMIANTCASEIEMAVEEYQANHPNSNSAPQPTPAPQPAPQSTPATNGTTSATSTEHTLQEYFDYQERAIGIMKSYKDLLDNNIITQEEFDAKKSEILNFIRGIMIK